MVKSGSKEPTFEYVHQTRVSPDCFASQLTSTFGICCCCLLWTVLSVIMPAAPCDLISWIHGAAKISKHAIFVSFVVGTTVFSGALDVPMKSVSKLSKIVHDYLEFESLVSVIHTLINFESKESICNI
ncbi:hypothetical protein MKX03_018561 [Papaver bracteatum]|nr:hypothetical protein MKX03_018561 [Papaver bracteatum]